MKRWRVPLAGGAAALLFSVLFFVGFHQPRSDEITKLSADAEQLRSSQALLRRETQALEEVEARAGEFQAALGRLEELIPSGLAQDAVLAQLQDAAGGAGVELASVTFEDPQVPDGAPASEVPGAVLVEMPITAAVNGPFAGVTELLHRVETRPQRAVLIGAVALTEAEAGFPAVTGTWSGRAYALLSADDPILIDPDAPPTTSEAPAPAVTPSAATPPLEAS